MNAPQLRLDVFRLLAELKDAGISNSEVARRMGVSKGTLLSWKDGSTEPSYSDGLRLIEMHAYAANGQVSVPITDQTVKISDRQ